MKTRDQSTLRWTVVLRRQPVRLAEGHLRLRHSGQPITSQIGPCDDVRLAVRHLE